jgi:predicted dehydrogenase/threonine dehydrogenase-like Zn-dependent dehydrogenase
MQQIFQHQRSGSVALNDVPSPACRSDGVLVAVQASLISSGTERRKAELGGKSLLEKARARPDLVAQVIDRARIEGLSETMNLVRERLDAPQPLGYSAAGTIIEGGSLVDHLAVGQPVAIAGAGFANHAEVCSVPANLAAAVPQGVDPAHACFATVGAIALQGIRQAAVTPGESVAVIGLGLVGHLTTRLLNAYGHPVIGIDVSPAAIRRAESVPLAGGWTPDDPALQAGVATLTDGRGLDSVIVTAATSSNDPVRLAARLLRDRGRVVVVGDVGLALERTPLYEKELDLRLSRSYGPGRYDRAYEEHGLDYPVGYVRWTEQRNLSEVVRLIATGRLQVDDLITHRYPIDQAVEAYRTLVDPNTPSLAIVLSYPTRPSSLDRTVQLEVAGSKRQATTTPSVSMLGAGNFASRVLIPALRSDGRLQLDTVVTRSGATSAHIGRRAGFTRCSSDPADALDPRRVQAVVIATRHDSHSELAARAIEAGLAVFVEKPLAIDQAGLGRVTAALQAHPGILLVGFNRRFAEPTRALLQTLSRRTGPGLVNIRVAAGTLPEDHWVLDEVEGGGRIVGEICHFLDLASFLLGQTPVGVYARISDLHRTNGGNVSIIVDYSDRSTAQIQYHSVGGKRMPKELIEAAWDGESARIEDFRTLEVWGPRRAYRKRWPRQDKGHRREIAAFVDWVLNGTPAWQVDEGLAATATTLAVLRSLETGQRVEVVSASPGRIDTSPTVAPGDL